MIRRPLLVAAAFVVSALVLFGALARITAMTLALEKSERAALQRATEEENVRIALWRIDATLTELIAIENTRPSVRFRSAAEQAGLPLLAKDESAEPRQLVRARFEVGADRKLRAEPKLETPAWVAALPIPEQPPRTARRPPPRPPASSPATKEPEAQIAQAVKPPPPEAPPPAAVEPEPKAEEGAETPPASIEDPILDQRVTQQKLEKIPTAHDPWAVLKSTPGVLTDRINVGGNESGQQSQYVQGELNLQAFERRRELGQQTAALAQQVSTPPVPPGARVEEVESAFEARWMGDDLVLLRRIRRGDERLLQGTVLDWPALRTLLLARVEAVVPASRLEAIGGREEADPGRRLALMPARLVPGPMREAEPRDWMPLRLSIAAAWVAALLGLVGIGSLLKGAMTLSQRRADFVSAVTHELRTPLTTFRMYTEMLAEGMVPAEERPSYLATLKREADRLGHLIENVLAFSRLERRAAAVRIESVPLAELLDRTVPRLRERAAQEGLDFQVETPPDLRVRVDFASAEQILFNLVDNACKYAPNPARPALQLTAAPRGRYVVLRLHDQGPGIEPRERRRIFRPFHRSAARAAGNAPGVGLGLALSRRLARGMGGDLRLAGSEEGASFELWLPTPLRSGMVTATKVFFVMALALMAALAGGCGSARPDGSQRSWAANVSAFEREIEDLRSALAIPGLAYVIVKDGEPVASKAFGSVQEAAEPFTTASPLRIASVTKSFTSVVVMQLVEEGRLDLDAPARHYVPDLAVPEDVLVRHLLTHTSEGAVGEEYVYGTARYAKLGRVIEAVTGSPFEQVLRERVLERAGMRVYPSPALGAHAGLVSTTQDMGHYLEALGSGRLLKASTLERLTSPSRSTTGTPLPVSLGWFAQTIQGQRIVWSFGQDDPEHSGALLVYAPERGISLFVLANSNVLSDPFSLLMGDVSKSPFAMSFLRLFVFSGPGAPLSRPERGGAELAQELAALEERTAYRYRDELVGWALIDLWADRASEAQRKIDLALTRYEEDNGPDAVVHFAALRLPETRSKDAAIESGARLLALHPNNRWMLLAQGYLLQQRERFGEASACFRRILDLPNQEPDFLNRLFKAWSWMALAQMSAEHDPAQARLYLRNLIDSGIKGDMLEEAKAMLSKLEGAPAGEQEN